MPIIQKVKNILGVQDFQTTEEEENLWNFLNTRFEEAKADRPDADWSKWFDLYNFKHWMETRPSYKAELTTNYCFSNVETVLPIMTDQPPRVYILPQSDKDIDYARVMEMVLDYVWTTVCDLDYTLPMILKTALIIGTSFIKVSWNQHLENLGDIEVIPLKPDSVYVDPLARDMKSASFVIISEIKPLEEIKELYPEQGDRVLPDENYSGERPQAMVLECWFKDRTLEDAEEDIKLSKGKIKVKGKRRKYPKGRVIIAANRVILKDTSNPYKDGMFPVIRFIDYPRTDSFWGRGEVEPIESPQMEYNKRRSQVVDIMNLTANPVWILDRQSGVNAENLVNRPGLIIEKNQGSEVRRESPPTLPAYVFQSMQDVKADIDAISGVHDITQGRKPTGITAASSILELQEAAQTRIRLKTRFFEASLRELAKLLISRIQQFYTEDRLVRLVSPDQQPMIFTFKSTMELTDIQNKGRKTEGFKQNFDVKIASGSTLPVSKTARFQQAVQLYQMDAIDQEALLEAAEFPNRTAVVKRMNEAKQAQLQAQMQAQQPSAPIEGMPPEGVSPEGMPPEGLGAALGGGPGAPMGVPGGMGIPGGMGAPGGEEEVVD